MNYQYHISHIKSKLSKSIGILHKLKFMLPQPVLLNLYYSLVFPYLSYAIEIWHSAPRYLTHQIFVLQKKAIRAVHLLPYNAETNNYFKISNLLKLEELYKAQSCIQLYQALNSTGHCLRNYLNFRFDVTNRATRFRNHLDLPQFRRTRSQQGFLFSAIKEWNRLPDDIKLSKSQFQFKTKLKNHYLSLY